MVFFVPVIDLSFVLINSEKQMLKVFSARAPKRLCKPRKLIIQVQGIANSSGVRARACNVYIKQNTHRCHISKTVQANPVRNKFVIKINYTYKCQHRTMLVLFSYSITRFLCAISEGKRIKCTQTSAQHYVSCSH